MSQRATMECLLLPDPQHSALPLTSMNLSDVFGVHRRYVHRVGRTARMGSAGEALLFLLPSEAGYTAMLAARGVTLRAQPLMPLLDCLDCPDEPEAMHPDKLKVIPCSFATVCPCAFSLATGEIQAGTCAVVSILGRVRLYDMPVHQSPFRCIHSS